MKSSRQSTVDWEQDIYGMGAQINRWPYTPLVSAIMRETAGKDRSVIRVLEVGCGTANNVRFLAEEGFQAAGIDLSPTAIEFARKRFESLGLEADLRAGDMIDLPWPDNSFDIVLDRGALTQNAYPQVSKMLDEAARVLKPGAVIMAFTLKSLEHPGRKFGTEVSDNTYDNFTDGAFTKVGLTSFFNAQSIRRLFARFDDIRINQQSITDEHGRLEDAEFSVHAVLGK